jgi:hypothetical protein
MKHLVVRGATALIFLLLVLPGAVSPADPSPGGAGLPDLVVTGIVNTVPASTVFALEPNAIRVVNIKNEGAADATSIVVRVYASDVNSGNTPVAETVISSLGADGRTTVDLVDPTIRNAAGGTITYTARVDPDNRIPESSESNNDKPSAALTVKYNGYKGAQYWPGKENISTYLTYDLHGGIVHSFGDSRYRSGSFGKDGWTSYEVHWGYNATNPLASDIRIPGNATVKAVRLYVPYTWDNSNEAETIGIRFNGATIPRAHWEKDESNFGAYADHSYGLMTYDVTDSYLKNQPNTAVLTRANPNAKLSPAGLTLLVVYEDPAASRKQIFINEGWDLLGADVIGYGTTEEEATSYQEFSGMIIDMASAKNAMLTTFVPWGTGQDTGRSGEGNLLVNGRKVASDVWSYGQEVTGESDSPQVAVDTRDILPYLTASGTGNVIGIQSTAGNTPAIVAERAILVIDTAGGAQEAGPATTRAAPGFATLSAAGALVGFAFLVVSLKRKGDG